MQLVVNPHPVETQGKASMRLQTYPPFLISYQLHPSDRPEIGPSCISSQPQEVLDQWVFYFTCQASLFPQSQSTFGLIEVWRTFRQLECGLFRNQIYSIQPNIVFPLVFGRILWSVDSVTASGFLLQTLARVPELTKSFGWEWAIKFSWPRGWIISKRVSKVEESAWKVCSVNEAQPSTKHGSRSILGKSILSLTNINRNPGGMQEGEH